MKLMNGRRPVHPGEVLRDTAMRLARYFHGEAQAWMNLQARYDLRRVEISKGRRIRSEVKPSRS